MGNIFQMFYAAKINCVMAPKDDTFLEFLSVCKKLAKHLGEF